MSVSWEKLSEVMFGSVGFQKFIHEYWPDREIFLARHSADELYEALGFAALPDVDDILGQYTGPVMAYGRSVLDITEGLFDRALLPSDRARDLYVNGAALEFDFANSYFKNLQVVVDTLSKGMACPAGTFVKAIVYAAQKSGGLKPHFDAYINIVFQLRGVKTWYFKKNSNVTAPRDHYEASEYPYVPPTLAKYWQDDLPANFFDDPIRIDLEPGDILMVPQGWWHATRSDEPTLAVNLTFSVPCFADVFLSKLRSEMLSVGKFRELLSPTSDPMAVFKSEQKALDCAFSAAMNSLNGDDTMVVGASYDVYQEAGLLFRQLLAS